MAKKSPKLFDALRTDPKKVSEGVWITHPDTGDSFRVRKLWCPEHMRVFLQAVGDYQEQHGEKSHETEAGATHVESVAMAGGLIIDWKIVGQKGLAYDAAKMAAAIADPELEELRSWLRVSCATRSPFRPENAAGNS